MAWLAVGATIQELGDGELLVGSGPEAQWRVTSAGLGPSHFVVSVRGANVTLLPASRDVVVVINGEQLRGTSRPLADGDAILAGSGRFLFSRSMPTPSASQEPPAAVGFLVDDQAGVAHPLGPSTLIGRDASNAIILRDPTASRFHADVRTEAGGFVLRSLGASGTRLNRQLMETPTLLAEGDRIEVAFAVLRFTSVQPTGDIVIAPPQSPTTVAAGRRPTLGADGVVRVEEANKASRGARVVQIIASLVIVAAIGAMWWWASKAG
jgi:pSer/pThr/pTyr-binding forkhead associated (FHA) protein